jgi:hypothetical protein
MPIDSISKVLHNPARLGETKRRGENAMMNPMKKKPAPALPLPLNTNVVLDLGSISIEKVSPEIFLKLMEEAPEQIKSAKIVPPELGSNDFGEIVIEWKSPTYGRRLG